LIILALSADAFTLFSELKLQRELDGAGAVDLIEGVEAAVLAATAQPAIQRPR